MMLVLNQSRVVRSLLVAYRRAIISKKFSTENAESQDIAHQEKIQLSKPTPEKWKRPPFLKDIFFGKFDVELMAFPQVLDKEQVLELENKVKVLHDVMLAKADSLEIIKKKQINDSLLQDLKDCGLFGRLIPAKYGGLELSYSAQTRLNEVLSLNWSVASAIAAHESFAAQILLQFGSESLKSKYLPEFASGKRIASVCCSEFESGSDLLSMSTTASVATTEKYIISGTKCWVSNGGIAGSFIVFAKTRNVVDPNIHDISAFLVDREEKNVEVIPQDTLCLPGLNTCVVKFNDVEIPKENLIGSLGHGFGIFFKGCEHFRLALHSITFGALKAIFDSVTDRIINNERVEKSLGDNQLIRIRLSKIQSVIYAMESISYFTAAIMDTTENPDIDLETVAMKIFNSEGTLWCIRELIDLVGAPSLLEEVQLDRFHRDALGLAIFDTPNDVMRLYLSLHGCKYVGARKTQEVLKQRNPFYFPWYVIKQRYRSWNIKRGNYDLKQDIAGHMHPSLVECGNNLEQKLQFFSVAVESVLTEHGCKVVETQIDPKILANIAVDLYAISAVLSRCSRSYCIGLKNSHHEIELATTFCKDADTRLVKNIQDVFHGVASNNEGHHLLIGDQIIDCQGYFPEHPLKHNI